MPLSIHHVRRVVQTALEEDSAFNDATTLAMIGDSDVTATANLVAKQPGIIAGIQVAEQSFKTFDPAAQFTPHLQDGQPLEPGYTIATITGNAASILSAERTALNLLQRMSGIATLTARYVAAVQDTNAAIVDTRKTVPGLRILDKYSVLTGGGGNHRMSLSDCILIKDNHITAMQQQGMTISDIVRHARSNAPFSMKIEIEVETVDDAIDATERWRRHRHARQHAPSRHARSRSAPNRPRSPRSLWKRNPLNRPRNRRNGRGHHLRRRTHPLRNRPRHLPRLQRRIKTLCPPPRPMPVR